MEWVLDQLALATELGATGEGPRKAAPPLVVPDAFTNPEYVRFAVKGMVAALTCYIFLIGFDYPGIYTSVITCFVVSLSTIGASNQKGLLRFGGAAVGGFMGLSALVYAFPNVDGIGGFWLVFGAGTAVAAWVNFGTPRISYGGYQTGLAFYKAVLQGFAPVVSATVVRDRLIGVFFGLIVFGIVEHLLWPVRARDQMRARMADVLASLADLARRVGESDAGRVVDVDAQRRLISQQVADVVGFVESSKFERGDDDPEEVARLLAGAQTVLLILLALARDARDIVSQPLAVQAATARLEAEVVTALAALADRVRGARQRPMEPAEAALDASERRLADRAGATREDDRQHGRLVLHRELVAAVRALISIEREPDRPLTSDGPSVVSGPRAQP